jgi:hypothetical protein
LWDKEMGKVMGVNTLQKSCKREMNCWSIFVFFGHFWLFLYEFDFHEKGQFMAILCPEGAQRILFTTKCTKDTEK